MRQRGQVFRTNGRRESWLGSAQTQNIQLHLLRSAAEGHLTRFEFAVHRTDEPPDFSGASVVFIGAHGSTGLRDYFRAVSDMVREFTPTAIAKRVSNCGCVILAVCSGGRGDPQTSSSETLGLASNMLAHGVRAIVAPNWPVDPTLMRYWLPVFLERLTSGDTVGMAAESARRSVYESTNHAIPALHLQLFGDPEYRI